jgi:AcrR family transcriptional regulator
LILVEIPTTVKNKELVERRRKQIVPAGIKLFSRNGFHKTTLKELAEEAGLSYSNIYDYVGSKEDIFFLTHDFLAGSAMEILNRSIEDIQDPIEKLRRMVRGGVQPDGPMGRCLAFDLSGNAHFTGRLSPSPTSTRAHARAHMTMDIYGLRLMRVQSHLVALGQLATIERRQVFEHDIPAPAQQGAAQKQHHFGGFPFPEDTRRLQAHVDHPAYRAFHAAGARRQIQMLESGVLHPVAVFEKVVFKLGQRLDSLFRPFDVLVDVVVRSRDS